MNNGFGFVWQQGLLPNYGRFYSENGGWSSGSRHHFWKHPETHDWIGQTAIRIGEHPELPAFLMPKLGYWLDFWSRDEWDPQQSVFFLPKTDGSDPDYCCLDTQIDGVAGQRWPVRGLVALWVYVSDHPKWRPGIADRCLRKELFLWQPSVTNTALPVDAGILIKLQDNHVCNPQRKWVLSQNGGIPANGY